MRYMFLIFGLLFLLACQRDFEHDRIIQNDSADTLTIINPDFDTVFTIFPGMSAVVYSYKMLDTKQLYEDCKWLGDSLIIKNQLDSVCTKSPKIEDNWTFTVLGPEKHRNQVCTMFVVDADF